MCAAAAAHAGFEPEIYPCQCVRTCVRAFHSHHAMDCCKHNRLHVRSGSVLWVGWEITSAVLLWKVESAPYKWIPSHFAKNSHIDFHVEPDIYPCQCIRTCVRVFHSHLAMDCCKHNRLEQPRPCPSSRLDHLTVHGSCPRLHNCVWAWPGSTHVSAPDIYPCQCV